MKQCQICSKSSKIGIDSSHKHGGGWAMRGPATRKVWQVNLQKQTLRIDGTTRQVFVCVKCWRKVREQMKNESERKARSASIKQEEKKIELEKTPKTATA